MFWLTFWLGFSGYVLSAVCGCFSCLFGPGNWCLWVGLGLVFGSLFDFSVFALVFGLLRVGVLVDLAFWVNFLGFWGFDLLELVFDYILLAQDWVWRLLFWVCDFVWILLFDSGIALLVCDKFGVFV